jgi:hypothetical protein
VRIGTYFIAWSVTLKVVQRLRVFENWMLKSTLGIERKEVKRWLDRITQ